ncbi:hypothetical protein [Halosegnis sp.]|uniref:hypothetical protein n=1 Tax=Halosegnis sp. TaxID=2864959 RepID=UPI0035D4A995
MSSVEVDRSASASRQLGRRGLLGFGAALLTIGWGGTALLLRSSSVAPFDPIVTAVGGWLAVFALIAGIAVGLCPRWVWYNRVVATWVGLNAAAFGYTAAAAAGLLPADLVQYAFWHVWVLAAVVGFAVTGAVLEGEDTAGQLYFTAAGLELSLLFLGLGAFGTLVPGLYLLLAFVHPTPLALDALPGDLSPGRTAAVQLGVYALGLGVVFLL